MGQLTDTDYIAQHDPHERMPGLAELVRSLPPRTVVRLPDTPATFAFWGADVDHDDLARQVIADAVRSGRERLGCE